MANEMEGTLQQLLELGTLSSLLCSFGTLFRE